MYSDDGEGDKKENFVAEKFLERIGLIWLYFSTIDLVENLKVNEDIEKNAIVFASFFIPIF